MHSSNDSFTLNLKIQNKQCKFIIHKDDDQDMLFQKLVEIYPQCVNRRQDILEKLRKDLEIKMNNANVKICLKATIQKFLDKTFYGKNDGILSSHKKNSPQKSRSRQKIERSRQKIQRSSFSKSKQNIVTTTPIQHTKSFNSVKKSEEQKVQKESSKKKKKITRPKSSILKQSPNQDVVKACQTILQKTCQSDIKNMAKKYLKEIGRLTSEESKTNKKEEIIKEEVQEKEQKEGKEPQHHQSLDKSIAKDKSGQKQQQSKIKLNQTQQISSISGVYRSPIEGINYNTQARTHNAIHSNVRVNNFKYNYDNPQKSLRGNRYNYLLSMQTNEYPITDYSSYQHLSILRQSSMRQRRYNYLENLHQ